jgi:hypothetical protein
MSFILNSVRVKFILELRTGRAGSGQAGPENSNFPDGPGPGRAPEFRPGPARPVPVRFQ